MKARMFHPHVLLYLQHMEPGEYDSGYDVSRTNMIKAIADLYKEEMKRQVSVVEVQ